MGARFSWMIILKRVYKFSLLSSNVNPELFGALYQSTWPHIATYRKPDTNIYEIYRFHIISKME